MGYIMDLRKIVGHRKLLMPGAGVFVYRDGCILLQKRRDNGLWADHGGAVELSERVEDAARRELKEETGLIAGKLEWIGLYSGPEYDYVYPNGDEVSMICSFFLCRDFSGELCLQEDEVAEVRWFPLDQLPASEEMHKAPYQALMACADMLRREIGKTEKIQ